MNNRRDFIKQSSLLVAGGLVAPRLLASNLSGSASGKYIGIQLYSLRDVISKSGILPVLETVAKIGYKNLETASYDNGKIYGMAPAEFKKRVTDLGMVCTSAHVGRSYSKEKEAEVMAWWDQAIEAHREAGLKYMIQASMPVNEKSSLDDLKTYCDYFSAIGEKAAKAGLQFGYHNHSFEFKQIGPERIYDYLVEHVDPEHVIFELDVYWCQEGGFDPTAYLKKYSKQIRLTHIKDVKEIGASGKMDFKAIFKQMKANKIKDWYVEIEDYTNHDPMESAEVSFEFLEKARYVE